MSKSSLRPRRQDTPDLNMTSLIDVVLLLLIFFMLSTTFNHNTDLNIELPEAKGTASDQSSKVIDISIDKSGRYLIDKQAINDASVDKLEQTLRQAINGRQDLTVQLTADGRTPHQFVITAMDAARRAGLLRFAFVTMQESQAIN